MSVTPTRPGNEVAGCPLIAAIAGAVQPTCTGESVSCSTGVFGYRNGCVELRNVSIAGSKLRSTSAGAHRSSSPNGPPASSVHVGCYVSSPRWSSHEPRRTHQSGRSRNSSATNLFRVTQIRSVTHPAHTAPTLNPQGPYLRRSQGLTRFLAPGLNRIRVGTAQRGVVARSSAVRG